MNYIKLLGKIELALWRAEFAIKKHRLICKAREYKTYYDEFKTLINKKYPNAKTGCYIGPELGAQKIDDIEIYFLVEGGPDILECDEDIFAMQMKLWRIGFYGIPIRDSLYKEDEDETIMVYE